jgi:hypothetical protein
LAVARPAAEELLTKDFLTAGNIANGKTLQMSQFNIGRHPHILINPKPGKSMRKLFTPPFALILIIISISIAHCAKTVDELKRDFVIDVMTSGRWVVESFSENNQDLSASFGPYEFQFYENGTVQGIRGAAITSGNWVGDAGALTIYSNFPSGDDTIVRLNDTWKITRNTLNLVEARPVNTGRNAFLKLVKK